MSKVISFTLNEQTHVDDDFVEQGLYNGFNKIIDLGTIKCIRRKPIGFSAKELGKLFVEIGNKLQRVNDGIDISIIETILRDNPADMGKQLLFEMTYKELENDSKRNV